MTDVILIATIVAFFLAAAVLVPVLDHMIADSGPEAGSDDEEPGPGQQMSRPA